MKNKAFTLIELLVAMSVFVLIVASSSGLLVSGLRIQRRSVAYQQLLDQTSYLAEYMSRAIRMAKKDISGVCTGTAKLNYSFTGQCLKFVNYQGQCQQFCLEGNRLKDGNGVYLTSGGLSVSAFSVVFSGETQSDDIQPKVGLSLSIQGKENSTINIQTTISQRNLDVRK